MTNRRVARLAIVPIALVVLAGCGSSSTGASTGAPSASPAASSGTPGPSPTSTASATSGLTQASVQAVVRLTFPGGDYADCALGTNTAEACPFTDRLKAKFHELSTQTPSPTGTGDICNFGLIVGTQSPVESADRVTITIDSARTTAKAAMLSAGEAPQAIVTLTVINAGGTPRVDDITYNVLNSGSIYRLNCSGSFGH